MKTVITILLCVFVGSSVAIYKIEKLDNSSGLLYMPKGSVVFEEDQWNILIHADISGLNERLGIINETFYIMEVMCDLIGYANFDDVEYIIDSLISQMDEFIYFPYNFKSINPNFIAGHPDEILSEKLIKMVKSHEKNPSKQLYMANHYTLGEWDLIDNKSTDMKLFTELYQKHSSFFNSLESTSFDSSELDKIEISDQLEDELKGMAQLFTFMVYDLIQDIDDLNRIIGFALGELVYPEIFQSVDFLHMLQESKSYIGDGLKYHHEPTLANAMKILDSAHLTVFTHNYKLMYLITLPLVSNIEFNLYKMSPIPIAGPESSFIFIQPSASYLAISADKAQYTTFDDLHWCTKISSERMSCPGKTIYFSKYRPVCETELIHAKDIPKSCDINIVANKLDIWHRIDELNSWLFIKSSIENLKISCPSGGATQIDVVGSGILTLEPNCRAKMRSTILKASRSPESFTTDMNSYVHLLSDPCCNKKDILYTLAVTKQPKKYISNINLDNLDRFSDRVLTTSALHE